MLSLVKHRLIDNREAAIRFPNNEEMESYAAMIKQREPEVNNVIGFIDGLAIHCQCNDDVNNQNAHYNGYHHDTTVNNVLAFAPTGKVVYACLNFPGKLILICLCP